MTILPNIALTSNTDGTRSRSWTVASSGSHSGHPLPQAPVLPSLFLNVLPSQSMEQMDITPLKEGNGTHFRVCGGNGRKKRSNLITTTPLGRSNNSCSVLSQRHHSGHWPSPMTTLELLRHFDYWE